MKPRYVPDLQDAAAVATANYIRLQRLFPESCQPGRVTRQAVGKGVGQGEDQGAGLEKTYQLVQQDRVIGQASFQLLECFAFTATLNFHYACQVLQSPQSYHVRVYQDACMAEVVLSETGRQLHGVYPYPNQKMYQTDEKQQLNRLLSEALSHCLSHGVAAEPTYSL